MKKRLVGFLVLQMMIGGLIILPTHALPLGSFDINVNMGSRNIFDEIHHTIRFEGGFFNPTSGAAFDFILSTDSVGQTFTISSGSEFDKAVTYLTNDVNDSLLYETFGSPGGGGGGTGSNEASLFFGDHTGAGGVDFAGSEITSIDLIVNTLNFDTPGRNPNGDGLWTNVIFTASVVINGNPATVPEPTTFFMFGIGLVATILYRSIRSR